MELGQGWRDVLDRLDSVDVVNLCMVSNSVCSFCYTYLPERIKRDLNNPRLNIGPRDVLASYIKIMSQVKQDFVVRGSENYVSLDEAIYRAVRLNNIELINYFLRQSPNVNQGCDSRELLLVVMAAIGNKQDDIALQIMGSCNFPWRIRIRLYYLALIMNNSNLAAIMRREFGVKNPTGNEVKLWHLRLSELVAGNGFVPIADMLEAQGVSKSFPNFWGLAIGDAAREGYFELVKYLADRKLGYLDYAISQATRAGQHDIVTYLQNI